LVQPQLAQTESNFNSESSWFTKLNTCSCLEALGTAPKSWSRLSVNDWDQCSLGPDTDVAAVPEAELPFADAALAAGVVASAELPF
jgi:hypothetical protein